MTQPRPALSSHKTKQVRRRRLCAPALAPWLPALRPPACFLVVIADVSPLCHTRLNRPLSSSWREKLKQRGALAWGLYRVKCGITSDTQTSETPPVPRGNAGRKRQSSIREPRWSQCNHSAGRSGGLLFGLMWPQQTNKQTLCGFKTLEALWDPSKSGLSSPHYKCTGVVMVAGKIQFL